MKILNAKQIKEADAFTIAHEPIASIDLMERAAMACTEEIREVFSKEQPFYIFCGTGNNGGDGLAIGRLLYDEGFQTEIYVLDFSGKESEDFTINKNRLLHRGISLKSFSEGIAFPEIPYNAVIIDAIFGTGLSGPVKAEFTKVISNLNQYSERGIPVLSIDMPSGLFDEDNRKNDFDNVVKAYLTLTFQVPKLSFLFPENAPYIGDWKVLDIQLNKEILAKIPTPYYFIDFELAFPLLKRRHKFSHKGNFGHALMIAGSYGKMGAAVLASKAALRSGAGLVSAHIPKCGYNIIQAALPEAMASIDRDEMMVSESIKTDAFSAIGMGPGIGLEKDTQNVLKVLIQNASQPLILDADALNILSENKTWLSFLPPNSILTPHPKEFERLAGRTSHSFDRLEMAMDFAKKHKAILVLKGAFTAVCAPDGSVYFNSSGNPGMATGGSGDVLTGVITGLAAQKIPPLEAAVLGVYIHGLAADMAAQENGETALIAGDIIDYLPKAFKFVEFQS
ncbi:MAG: NAD(P)H-hydrate dehydratase [Bacteroidetes bacterium]|nr:NAD(P)H-hydrate dehydratase [Bacteroidota bacterium]